MQRDFDSRIRNGTMPYCLLLGNHMLKSQIYLACQFLRCLYLILLELVTWVSRGLCSAALSLYHGAYATALLTTCAPGSRAQAEYLEFYGYTVQDKTIAPSWPINVNSILVKLKKKIDLPQTLKRHLTAPVADVGAPLKNCQKHVTRQERNENIREVKMLYGRRA